jgi:hypothetical protein
MQFERVSEGRRIGPRLTVVLRKRDDGFGTRAMFTRWGSGFFIRDGRLRIGNNVRRSRPGEAFRLRPCGSALPGDLPTEGVEARCKSPCRALQIDMIDPTGVGDCVPVIIAPSFGGDM